MYCADNTWYVQDLSSGNIVFRKRGKSGRAAALEFMYKQNKNK